MTADIDTSDHRTRLERSPDALDWHRSVCECGYDTPWQPSPSVAECQGHGHTITRLREQMAAVRARSWK